MVVANYTLTLHNDYGNLDLYRQFNSEVDARFAFTTQCIAAGWNEEAAVEYGMTHEFIDCSDDDGDPVADLEVFIPDGSRIRLVRKIVWEK